jgi:hypothetical protein
LKPSIKAPVPSLAPTSHVQEQEAERIAQGISTEGSIPLTSVDPLPARPALTASVRAHFERRLGHDFSRVRIHADQDAAQSAQRLRADAWTVGPNIGFARGRFDPGTRDGVRLLAHELAHVVQQGAASPLSRAVPSMSLVRHKSAPRLARKDGAIAVQLVASRDEYTHPGFRLTYRVGDAAASRLLMDIVEIGPRIVFRVFNFETGEAQEMSPPEWEFYRGAAMLAYSGDTIARLGRQLRPSEWRSLWPDPMPELLRRFEAGQLSLEDEAVLAGYRGMVRSDARRSLDENEKAIDELLDAPDRVKRIQEYATGLREASVVRDTLTQRRDELSRMLVAQHSFTFGLPHAGTGPNVVQTLNIHLARDEVDDTLAFWLSSFPLLTRFQTADIDATAVEAKLREIKANIVSVRRDLNQDQIDPMTLDVIRGRLAGGLGPKATAVVGAQDKSRRRWAIAGAIAMTAATIAILFLPGGIFIDAAIGVAMAAHAITEAFELGHQANTGLSVDDGLVSQAQASGARFAAALAVIFAVVGVVGAGLKVLRFSRAFLALGRSMPELAAAQRAAVARAIVEDPKLVATFAKLTPGDAAISSRVAAAVRAAAGNPRALRTALTDVARIAAIPRRILTKPDAYEPLRQIVDGSDIAQIARQTGLSRAQVAAAKEHFMFAEHVLVDDTGALVRGRFDAYEDVAKIWGRAAKGEALNEADRAFLRKLVVHEQVEGSILSTSAQTLEQAFLSGQLETNLRTFLRSKGVTAEKIDAMMALEPKPVTPYRYAHIVAHYSGAPNP